MLKITKLYISIKDINILKDELFNCFIMNIINFRGNYILYYYKIKLK